MRITPNNAGLGARVEGVDLSRDVTADEFRTLLRALGQHGVLCFPGQDLDAAALSAFGSRFGELEVNVANIFHAEGHPEVMHLSNMKDADGKPIGLSDAGQGWHTDMSYSKEIALANVLHAKRVPRRDGRAIGCTHDQSGSVNFGVACRCVKTISAAPCSRSNAAHSNALWRPPTINTRLLR